MYPRLPLFISGYQHLSAIFVFDYIIFLLLLPFFLRLPLSFFDCRHLSTVIFFGCDQFFLAAVIFFGCRLPTFSSDAGCYHFFHTNAINFNILCLNAINSKVLLPERCQNQRH